MSDILINESMTTHQNNDIDETCTTYIKDVYLYELNKCTIDEIKDEIDGYDEHLYELLIPYVQDREGAYEELQEFKHDRHANDWIDS